MLVILHKESHVYDRVDVSFAMAMFVHYKQDQGLCSNIIL